MDASERNRPELLAPAGDWDALRAAVANGADAVYFGLPDFNARQRATNFQRAELVEVLAYLHDHNVKGYVTFNTLVFSDELPRAAEYATAIAEAGADAVIVQDLGLLRLLRRLAPTLPIHASTQMTQTEAGGIEYLRALGVSRVILARELSLPEIACITRATPVPLEVFVHGALCISYSGQCLASEAFWGRSANRGVCGQACRLPYELVVDGRRYDLGDRPYLLSPQDLAAYDLIPRLVELGIAGFKIEGRLKSAHYVAAATRVYRAALDAALRGVPFAITAEQQAELVQSFSRGLCHGFLDGVNHQQLVQGRFPRKRGVHLGEVVAMKTGGVVVQLADRRADLAVKPGDGVVFDDGHPERDEQGGRVYSIQTVPSPGGQAARATRRATRPRARPAQPNCVRLTFGSGDVNLAAVPIGSKVYKTDDPTVRRRLETSYRRDVVARRVPLHVRVQALAGQPLRIDVRDDAGHAVCVTTAQPLRAAEKHPLTPALIRQQWARLGNTPFELATVELQGSRGPADSLPLMVPKSVLNDLRRRAVEALRERRTVASQHAVAETGVVDALRAAILVCGRDVVTSRSTPQLHVLVRTPEQFHAVATWAPASPSVARGILYCDFGNSGDYEQAMVEGRSAGWDVGLATPRVLMPGEERELSWMAELAPDAVLVRNLGALRVLRARSPRLTLVGDASLNVANELAAAELLERGLCRWTPAHEASGPQLRAILGRTPTPLVEVIVHQHVPLFHTRHCLFAACRSDGEREKKTGTGTAGGPFVRTRGSRRGASPRFFLTLRLRCGDCGWRCRSHELYLRDRVGALHPVWPEGLGRHSVFGAAACSAAESVVGWRGLGVRHYRVELLCETPAQVPVLVDSYVRMLGDAGH